MQKELNLSTVVRQLPKLSGAGKVGFHMIQLLCDLEAAQILGRNIPVAHGLWQRGGQIS